MKLLYLTSEKGKEPSEALKGRFDSVRVVRINEGDFRENATPALAKMSKAGSVNYDPEEFFLYTNDVADIGETIARKKLNAGVVDSNDVAFYPFFQIDGKHYVPKMMMGDVDVGIVHATQTPSNGLKQRVLFVAPHFEEETALIGGLLHKLAGDDIHIMFATNVPDKPGFAKKSEQVYRQTLGLREGEYSFVGIEDMRVKYNKEIFQRALETRIREFDPTVVIMPPEGANVDHKYAVRFAFPILQDSGVDVLFGDVVQHTRIGLRQLRLSAYKEFVGRDLFIGSLILCGIVVFHYFNDVIDLFIFEGRIEGN